MDWIAASLATTAIFALVSILDKKIISSYVPSIASFYIPTGALQFLVGIIAFFVVGWKGNVSGVAMTAAISSGILWGGGLMLMFYTLRTLEVSRVVAVFHTYPVWVAIMAVLFLDEYLLPLQWTAMLIVVLGAGLVTIERRTGSKIDNTGKPLRYLFLIIASMVFGGGNVVIKLALEEMAFWNLFAIGNMGLGIVLVLGGIRRGVLKELMWIATHRPSLMRILLTEGVIAPGANYLRVLALSLGPVSLVSTVLSARPLLVLLYTILLSTRFWNVMNEPLSRDTLALKFLATTMIVAGVSTLALA